MIRVFRFIYALIKFILIGDTVDDNKYNTRLVICDNCKDKCGRTCCICGCYIKKKAKWSTESCPKNKW